jgi:hypothetical protein
LGRIHPFRLDVSAGRCGCLSYHHRRGGHLAPYRNNAAWKVERDTVGGGGMYRIVMGIMMVLGCLLLGWIGSCAYNDYKEFTTLLPKCEQMGGRLKKIGGEYICVQDLFKVKP